MREFWLLRDSVWQNSDSSSSATCCGFLSEAQLNSESERSPPARLATTAAGSARLIRRDVHAHPSGGLRCRSAAVFGPFDDVTFHRTALAWRPNASATGTLRRRRRCSGYFCLRRRARAIEQSPAWPPASSPFPPFRHRKVAIRWQRRATFTLVRLDLERPGGRELLNDSCSPCSEFDMFDVVSDSDSGVVAELRRQARRSASVAVFSEKTLFVAALWD